MRKTTIHSLPFDLILNIMNYLPVNDVRSFGTYYNSTNKVKNHMLSNEYISHYLKNETVQSLYNVLLKKAIMNIREINNHFQGSVLKPVRVNINDGGVLYSLRPHEFKRSFYIADMNTETFKDVGFSFQNITKSETEMYYSKLDVFMSMNDDPMTSTRHIFLRIPYESEEYVYAFGALLVKIVANMLESIPLLNNWNIVCEYMLFINNKYDSLVRPISKSYNTRNVNTFKHEFLERLLKNVLLGNKYQAIIKPWDMNKSIVLKYSALKKFPSDLRDGIEEIIQDIGFPHNNEKMSDIYLNIGTMVYYEFELEYQENEH